MGQISEDQIRRDLKLIREFYKYRLEFEKTKAKPNSYFIGKIKTYNKLIKFAPIQLQSIYFNLYIHGDTLEVLADKMCYAYVHLQRLHKRIIDYFYSIMNVQDFVV